MKVVSIKRRNGVAGQIAYVATVDAEEGEATVMFVGSVYGGPVVMVTAGEHQVFVSDPGRFGKFGLQWVRRFFREVESA